MWSECPEISSDTRHSVCHPVSWSFVGNTEISQGFITIFCILCNQMTRVSSSVPGGWFTPQSSLNTLPQAFATNTARILRWMDSAWVSFTLLLCSDTASIHEAKRNILACIFEFLIKNSNFSNCVLEYINSSASLVLSKGWF